MKDQGVYAYMQLLEQETPCLAHCLENLDRVDDPDANHHLNVSLQAHMAYQALM